MRERSAEEERKREKTRNLFLKVASGLFALAVTAVAFGVHGI